MSEKTTDKCGCDDDDDDDNQFLMTCRLSTYLTLLINESSIQMSSRLCEYVLMQMSKVDSPNDEDKRDGKNKRDD